MIKIARLILQALPVADVAHERFDAQPIAAVLGMRSHLHPHRRLISAPQAKQVVADGAVVLETADKSFARLGIDEALELERTNVLLIGLDAETKHQLEMRVGGQRLTRFAIEGADIDTLVHRLEESRERFRRWLRAWHQCGG